MKKLIALLLAALMIVGMAACGAKENTPAPAPEASTGTETQPSGQEEQKPETESGEPNYLRLPLGLNDTLSGLKPLSTAGYGLSYCYLCSTLMKLDTETNTYVNALADKVEVSDDGLVYTVTLGDHKFHDGTPITADDVVFSYNYEIFCGGSRVSLAQDLVGYADAKEMKTETCEGIKKVDDKTVEFTLTNPNNLFYMALSNSNFGIIPASYFEGMSWTEINDNEAFWKAPVGSGAYMVDETNYPSYITLKAFEDFYDPAGVKNILMTAYTDTAAEEAAYFSGQVDWIFGVEHESAANIQAAAPNTYYEQPFDSSYQRWFMINFSGTAGKTTTHPSLSNPRVRHAINMLLDKNAIATLYGVGATPLTGHINASNPNYNTDVPTWERDVEGAVAILKEENFAFDVPIRIFSNYGDQTTVDFLELVKQQLGEGGVQVTYTVDTNWQNYLSVQDYDFRYAGGQQAADINWYGAFIALSGQTDLTRGNYPMDDPEFVEYMTTHFDELVAAYKASQDPEEQKELIAQLQYNAYEYMIDIPLYSLAQVSLFTNRFSMAPVLTNDNYEYADFQFSSWALKA